MKEDRIERITNLEFFDFSFKMPMVPLGDFFTFFDKQAIFVHADLLLCSQRQS